MFVVSRSSFLFATVLTGAALACANDPPTQTKAAAPAAPTVVARDDLFAIIEKAGFDGAFVVLDPQTNTITRVNGARCDEGFCPASTFKIPNSLIGLEHKAVADVDVMLPWDGVNREIPGWNRDHSMRTAFKESAVWYYQEIARRVGIEAMTKAIADFHYGNEKLGGTPDLFWLDGDLRITPVQQVEFLRRMREGALPVAQATTDAVLDIMVLEKDEHVTLRAKTGWASPKDGPDIGWWVGMLETDGKPIYFATLLVKLDADGDVFRPARRELGQQLLRELGYVLPKPQEAPRK